MARKQKPKPSQPEEQVAPLLREIENLKRDVSGHTRDIEDCRRDVRQCRKDVDNAVRKRPVWFVLALAVLGFLGYTSWTGIKSIQTKLLEEAEKQLQKQVATLYEEKHVTQVVDHVIRTDANDLIRRTVETQTASILDDLKHKQEEQSQVLTAFRRDQEKYATITLLHDLIIKAESGDVMAFRRLARMATLPDPALSEVAKQSARRVWDTYFNQSDIITRHFNDTVPESEVANHLSSENFINRRLAVFTVRRRKMYGQIPQLIDRITTETSLDVLAAIETVLNTMLGAHTRSCWMTIRSQSTKSCGNRRRTPC